MKVLGLGGPELVVILIELILVLPPIVLTPYIGNKKGYELWVGILLGLILSWIGLIIIGLMPKGRANLIRAMGVLRILCP